MSYLRTKPSVSIRTEGKKERIAYSVVRCLLQQQSLRCFTGLILKQLTFGLEKDILLEALFVVYKYHLQEAMLK